MLGDCSTFVSSTEVVKLPSWKTASVILKPAERRAIEGVGIESRFPRSAGGGENISAESSGKTSVEASPTVGFQDCEVRPGSSPVDSLDSIPTGDGSGSRSGEAVVIGGPLVLAIAALVTRELVVCVEEIDTLLLFVSGWRLELRRRAGL